MHVNFCKIYLYEMSVTFFCTSCSPDNFSCYPGIFSCYSDFVLYLFSISFYPERSEGSLVALNGKIPAWRRDFRFQIIWINI